MGKKGKIKVKGAVEEAVQETVRETAPDAVETTQETVQETVQETAQEAQGTDALSSDAVYSYSSFSEANEDSGAGTKESARKARARGRKKEKEKPLKKRMSKEQLKMYYKRRFRSNARVFPFLVPSLIGVLFFYLAPFGVVIYYVFVDNPITKNFVGFDNIVSTVSNESFQLAAKNTLKFSLMAVPLALVLALLLALLLDHKIPFASEFRTSYLSPMVVPVASVVLVFQVLFSFNGVFSEISMFFGGQKVEWLKSDWTPYIVLLLFLWKNLGYNMIMFLAALGNIPKDALEVAYLDTNNNWTIFWKIKIHYLSPTILFVTIISLINSFKVFREVYLLTMDYPYDSVYTLQHYMNNMIRNMDYQRMSSAAVLLAIVMSAIILGLYIAENKFGQDMEE